MEGNSEKREGKKRKKSGEEKKLGEMVNTVV